MNQTVNTGTVSVTLEDVTMAPAGPPHTYLGVAEQLLPAVNVLAAAAAPVSAWALSLLCGHTLECLLKAYLSRGGCDKHLKDPDIRHNLNALWEMAVQEQLSISAHPPNWVARLSALHNKPYYLRYSTGVHGIVMPPPAQMASELAALMEVVRAGLR